MYSWMVYCINKYFIARTSGWYGRCDESLTAYLMYLFTYSFKHTFELVSHIQE